MDKIVVEGGARLVGKIPISGAKNAALPLLAAALLPSGASTFKNVPQLEDVSTMAKLLRKLGWTVDGTRAVTIAPPAGKKQPKLEAPYELVKTMRASVLVLGPLVARYGQARVSMPGGCAIGARPIDQHLKGLVAWRQCRSNGYAHVGALRGRDVSMPTVTGRRTRWRRRSRRVRTVIENAREPEVEEPACANKMGARVRARDAIITRSGVARPPSDRDSIIPDRTGCSSPASHEPWRRPRGRAWSTDAVIAKLHAHAPPTPAAADPRRRRHRVDCHPAAPRPPTDMQAQFAVPACLAKGQR